MFLTGLEEFRLILYIGYNICENDLVWSKTIISLHCRSCSCNNTAALTHLIVTCVLLTQIVPGPSDLYSTALPIHALRHYTTTFPESIPQLYAYIYRTV